jgi:hypothetical protein
MNGSNMHGTITKKDYVSFVTNGRFLFSHKIFELVSGVKQIFKIHLR